MSFDIEDLALDAPPVDGVESELERAWNRIRNYGFCCGPWRFVLANGLYSELLFKPSISPLPNSPTHLVGLTNVRGNLVPVYALEPWLNAVGKAEAPTYVLVVDHIGRGAAVVVDEKPVSLDLREYKNADVPQEFPDQLNKVVERVYFDGSRERYLLNHRALFQALARADY